MLAKRTQAVKWPCSVLQYAPTPSRAMCTPWVTQCRTLSLRSHTHTTPAPPPDYCSAGVRAVCGVDVMRLPRVREEDVGFSEEGRQLGMPKRPRWRGVVSWPPA